MVYAAKGARLVLWSQSPEPVEDEHLQDFPTQGRAADLGMMFACCPLHAPWAGLDHEFLPAVPRLPRGAVLRHRP